MKLIGIQKTLKLYGTSSAITKMRNKEGKFG